MTTNRHPSSWLMACVVAATSLTYGCMRGPAFLKQSGEEQPAIVEKFFVVPTTTDGETATGTISSGLTETQVLQAPLDSSVAGSEVFFPAGSLAIDTSVSIGPGDNFVNDGVITTLDLGTGVNTAANAVAVQTSTPLDAAAPFTVALPLPGVAALTADADPYANLVVVYRIAKANAGGEFTGVMTRDQLKILDGFVRISTLHFGTYQAVITAQPVTVAVEKPAPPRIVTRKAYFRPGFVTTSFETSEPDQDGLRGFFHHVSKGRVGSSRTLSLDVLAKPASGE